MHKIRGLPAITVIVSALLLGAMLLLCLLLTFGAAKAIPSEPFTVQMLVDNAVMSPQQAQAIPRERWLPLSNASAPLGYGLGQRWFQVEFAAKDGYLLQVDAPFLDEIDFYLLRPTGELVQQVLTGDQRAFRQRGLQTANVMLPVSAEWQQQQLQLFIRVYNVGQTVLPLRYVPAELALYQSQRLQVLHSFFFGLMLFSVLLTTLSAVLTKQYHLMLFSSLLLCIAIVQGEISGFLFQWLWPAQPGLNRIAEWAVPVAVWSCAGFVWRYFAINQGWVHRLLLGFQWFAIGLLLVNLVLKLLPDDYWRAMNKQMAVYLMQVCVVVTLLIGLSKIRQQTQRALLFLLPMSVLLGAVVLAALRATGWLPDSDLTRAALELGSTMAAVLMSSNLLMTIYQEKARQAYTQKTLLERNQQISQLQQQELQRSKIAPFYRLGSRLQLVELLTNELQQPREQYRLLLIELQQYHRTEAVLGRQQTTDIVNAYVDSLLVLCQRHSQAVVTLGNARHQTIFALSEHRLALLVQHQHFAAVLTKIRKLLHHKFTVAGLTPDFNPRYASVTVHPQMGKDAEELLAHVALALSYVDKTAGHIAYQPQLSADSRHRLSLLAGLAHAIAQEQFNLLFQPIRSLATEASGIQQIVGIEAFIRWQHPQLGPVSPAKFIPLAEEAGLMSGITAWVYKEVRKRQNQLAEQQIPIQISMNLSGMDLQNPALIGEILRVEQKYPVAERLKFELAESAFTPDLPTVQKSLQLLRQANTPLVMDDFGAGQSMLSKLGSLPISELKLDMALLTMLDSHREQILAGAIKLAKALEMQVICEGVEHEHQFEFLTIHGADAAQGYYVARPMPFAELLRWFKSLHGEGSEFQPQPLETA